MSFLKSLFGSMFHDPADDFDVPGVGYQGRSIGSWFRDLSDPSAATRDEAALALATIGEPALAALEAACSAPTLQTRLAAASALGRIGTPALDSLVELLPDEGTRVCVPVALREMGPASLAHLLPLLEEGDESQCEGVAYTIADLAHVTPITRELIASAATSQDPLQPRGAGETVRERAELETPTETAPWDFLPFISFLTESLTAETASLRREAARALWHIGPASKLPPEPLVGALDDDDPETRLFAAGALAELDSHQDQALDVVLSALAADDEEQVRLAVHILPSFRPESATRAIGPLIDSLLHADPAVRHHAKLALAHLGGVAAPILTEAAKDPDADLRRRVASVLGEMRQQYAAFYDLPGESSETIGEMKARRESIHEHLPQILRCLIRLADDAEPSVSQRAVHALGFGSLQRIPPEVLDDYVKTLEKHDRIAFIDVIRAALCGTSRQRESIGVPLFEKIDESERAELLLDFLRDMVRTPEVRQAGAEAFDQLDLDDETLAGLISETDAWVTERAPEHLDKWEALRTRIWQGKTQSE